MGKHEVARRAVFLDRDGVLNRPVVRNGQLHPPARDEDFELYDDVVDGCARLKAAEFLLVVITNQPDVGPRLRGELARGAGFHGRELQRCGECASPRRARLILFAYVPESLLASEV